MIPFYSLFLCFLFSFTHTNLHARTHKTHTFLLSIQAAFEPQCHLSALAQQGRQLTLHLLTLSLSHTHTHIYIHTQSTNAHTHTHTLIHSARYILMRLRDHRRAVLIFIPHSSNVKLHIWHTQRQMFNSHCSLTCLIKHTLHYNAPQCQPW